MAKHESFSEQDTFFIGERMGQHAIPGTVVALDGDLGVGKTVFTKGFARGLGIEEDVVSPTFTIEQIYEEGRLPLYHFDIYRLEDEDEWYADAEFHVLCLMAENFHPKPCSNAATRDSKP
mgnify:CR=1 FL=1